MSDHPHSSHYVAIPDPYQHTEFLPLLVLIVPVVGSSIHGSLQAWQNSFLVALVLGYVINIVKTPWQLLHASHAKRTRKPSGAGERKTDAPQKAARELALMEFIAVLGALGSPFMGTYLLRWLREGTPDGTRFVDPFAITLFLSASSLKPFLYFLGRLKSGTLWRTVDVGSVDPEVAELVREVAEVKRELDDLDSHVAGTDEVEFLRKEAAIPLSLLDRAVRNHERQSTSSLIAANSSFEALSGEANALLHRLAETNELAAKLEREAEAYRHSLWAGFVALVDGWLKGLGAGMQKVGRSLEGDGAEGRRLIRARSDSVGSGGSEAAEGSR